MDTTIEHILLKIAEEYSSVSFRDLELSTLVKKRNKPPVLNYLSSNLIKNYRIEKLVTQLRRSYLVTVNEDPKIIEQQPNSSVISAISHACFNNEYIFNISNDEHPLLLNLKHSIENNIEQISLNKILLLSCYIPLLKNKLISDYIRKNLKGSLNENTVIRRQILDEITQKQLLSNITSLTVDVNDVGSQVKNHYENNPYPRWVSFEKVTPTTFSEFIQSKLAHISNISELTCTQNAILIAGCGTGLSSIKHAYRFPNADITAIDISYNSLAYAKFMAEQLGLSKIKFIHADISGIKQLGIQFDYIECLGVLSHVEDPVTHCQYLYDVLKPKGMMRISLYNQNSRQMIIKLGKLIQGMGFTDDITKIRELRQLLINSDDFKKYKEILEIGDFYSLSGFRDMLFHKYERNYSLNDVFKLVSDLQMKWVGLEFAVQSHLNKDIELDNTLASYQNIEKKQANAYFPSYQFWAQK